MSARTSVFPVSWALILLATDAHAHGMTVWLVVLFSWPFLLIIAAVCALLGGIVKRHLMKWLVPGAHDLLRGHSISVFRVEEMFVIPACLTLATYFFEEVLKIGFFDYRTHVLVFIATIVPSSAILLVPHMRMLSRTFGGTDVNVSFTDRLRSALLLSVITPGLFALVLAALLRFRW